MCAREGRRYSLLVNGFLVNAVCDEEEIRVLDRIIDRICALRKRKPIKEKQKTIAFLSGPPGAGKSTFALCLCARAKERGAEFSFECLGLDGFHRTKEALMNMSVDRNGRVIRLIDIKGAPETFDGEAFLKTLNEVKDGKNKLWPVYDRRIHDVSDEKNSIEGDVLVVEGNWLMLSGVWKEARKACDLTLSIDAEDALLRERLIERKIRGGKTKEEAHSWYECVDGPNIAFYRDNSDESDVCIVRKNRNLSILNEN